jgi:pilus assembly protein Flp/PilA
MKPLILWISSRKFWRDTQGQDLIEYALMVGFVAVAAGAIMPGVGTSIAAIFTKLQTALTSAGG